MSGGPTCILARGPSISKEIMRLREIAFWIVAVLAAGLLLQAVAIWLEIAVRI